MGLSLQQVVGNVASLSIDFGEGATLHLTYLPSMITDKTLALLMMGGSLSSATAANAGELLGTVLTDLNQSLTGLIKDWDFFEDDEQTEKVAVTTDRFSLLPIAFRMQVLKEIVGAGQMGEVNGIAPSTPSQAS